MFFCAFCSGIDLDGTTIGFAPVGVMCRGNTAGGITQDTGGSTTSVASTVAHEMGHIFNMEHDDGREYSRLYEFLMMWFSTSIL